MRNIIISLLFLVMLMCINAETIPFLGVATSDINHSAYADYGITDNYGILIKNVVEGSQAEKAGMKKGMIIRSYQGENVYTQNQLTRMIRNSKVGDKVKIVVFENENEKTFDVALGEKEYTEYKKPVWMGVSLSDDFDLENFDLNYGLQITLVKEESPAEQAGLKVDDVMLSIHGEKLYAVDQVRPMLKKYQSGDKVAVQYWRAGKKAETELELGELPLDWYDLQAIDQIFNGLDIMDDLDDVYGLWNSVGLPETMHVFAYQDSSSKILGVIVSDTYKEEDDSGNQDGLKIDKVIPETPAAEGGMMAGDIVLEINGEKVSEFDDIVGIISKVDYNDSFKVKIIRDDKPKDLILIMKPVTDEVWQKYYSGLLENDVIKVFMNKGKPIDFYYQNLEGIGDKLPKKIEHELNNKSDGLM
ncbi:MAG: PDZ domain-containing protein [Candidatus Stygibacter frigidus]|nr:PDZ domain-containing protein [Candidatus Stygibacter frigidus]